MVKLYDRDEVCQTYFFPQPGAALPGHERAGVHALALPDGTPVSAYWWRPYETAPCLLYLHGNGECIADQLGHWPRWAEQAGANILFVDYPGYGSSEGTPTFTSCCQCALVALDFLLDQPPDVVPAIVAIGRSAGTIFALHAAAGRADDPRIRGLVLESGIADLKPRLDLRLDYDQIGLDRSTLHQQVDEDFDNRSKLQRVDRPVLVMHARHDSLIPMWNAERLGWWAGERLHQLVLFDLGDHNTIQQINGPFYRKLLAAFITALS